MLDSEVFKMAAKSVRYTPEFKRQMVDLVRSGRSPAALAKEFEPTAWTIALWVRQAERDTGRKADGGLTSPEREELARLRRENRKLKEDREILSKAAAWFATESGTSKRSSGS
jgi:transposase